MTVAWLIGRYLASPSYDELSTGTQADYKFAIDKIMEAFGGIGVQATTPAELRAAMEGAIRSKKPTLINAVIDETAGTESGRITSLNPSAAKKA